MITTNTRLLLVSYIALQQPGLGNGCPSASESSTFTPYVPAPLPRSHQTALSDFLAHQLSKTVAEQDVSGLVLSVSVRVNQPFIDETGFNRAEFAEERRSQPRPSAVEPVVHRLFIEQAEQHDAQSAVGGCLGLPSEKVAVVEEDQVCVSSIVPSSEVEESELPAMLRVQECIER